MGSFFINKDPYVLVSNLDSYLTLRPPDCSLYSEDGQVFEVHKVSLSLILPIFYNFDIIWELLHLG